MEHAGNLCFHTKSKRLKRRSGQPVSDNEEESPFKFPDW